MAWLAVDKDGTEMISDYTLYRNGYYKRYPKCSPDKCGKYPCVGCKTDENGKRYKLTTYSYPPKMNEEEAIELLSFWDNFEYDPDGNKIDFTVPLPEGSIKKLIGRDLTWEDEPVELKVEF